MAHPPPSCLRSPGDSPPTGAPAPGTYGTGSACGKSGFQPGRTWRAPSRLPGSNGVPRGVEQGAWHGVRALGRARNRRPERPRSMETHLGHGPSTKVTSEGTGRERQDSHSPPVPRENPSPGGLGAGGAGAWDGEARGLPRTAAGGIEGPPAKHSGPGMLAGLGKCPAGHRVPALPPLPYHTKRLSSML